MWGQNGRLIRPVWGQSGRLTRPKWAPNSPSVSMCTCRHDVQRSLYEPDVYWERERLSQLYMRARAALAVEKRVRLVEEHTRLCCEQLDVLVRCLTDAKHTRLELYIIVLIAFEAGMQLLFKFL